ncbi:hypothetical protein JW916_12535 [Candidatus Sumerlaeota bacterium]|nr:hypothetical protein [Candidatus Sumerlaeota bacterium]
MSRDDIASLAFKMAGVYVLVVAVQMISSLPSQIRFVCQVGMGWGWWMVQTLSSVLGALLLLYAGIYLIKRTPRLVRLAFPPDAEVSNSGSLEPSEDLDEDDALAETTVAPKNETRNAASDSPPVLRGAGTQSEEATQCQQIQAAAFAVIGVWLFARALPSLLRDLAHTICAVFIGEHTYSLPSALCNLVHPIVSIAMGLLLFFGVNRLARFFSRLRSAGRPTFLAPGDAERS